MKEKQRKLFYGDCFDIINKHIEKDSIDCCYIDPPFNSKRNYNIIHKQKKVIDFAQTNAYDDIWLWNKHSEKEFNYIVSNHRGYVNEKTINLMKGFEMFLGKDSSLSYLVYMASRLLEIHRALKNTGSVLLHCDKTMVHYLKLILDSIFKDGEMINQIIWSYEGNLATKKLGEKHDTILWFSKKRGKHFFNMDAVKVFKRIECNKCGQNVPLNEKNHMKKIVDPDGRVYRTIKSSGKIYKYYDDDLIPETDIWLDISKENQHDPKRTGLQTQKPYKLLDRLVKMACPKGGVFLDAFCGCGTSVRACEKNNFDWIGIDISFNMISIIISEFKKHFDLSEKQLNLFGEPRDMQSVMSLINSPQDQVRKEIEKWACLKFTNKKAKVKEQAGKDGGIDGIYHDYKGRPVLLEVKSGNYGRKELGYFGNRIKEKKSNKGYFLVLKKPSKAQKQYGIINKIDFVSFEDILSGKRIEEPPIEYNQAALF